MRHSFVVVALAFALVALGPAMAGCQQPSPSDETGRPVAASMTEADDGSEVQLAIGERLRVDLEENISTGYSWAVDGYLPSVVTTASDSTEAPADTGVVGAAGRRILEYEAVESGRGDLRLVYVRPWEKGVAPARTFSLTIVVR